MTRLAATLLFPFLFASIALIGSESSFGAVSEDEIPVLVTMTAKAFHYASHGDEEYEQAPKAAACYRARSKALRKAVKACKAVGGTPLEQDSQVSDRGFEVPPFSATCNAFTLAIAPVSIPWEIVTSFGPLEEDKNDPPHPMDRTSYAYYQGHGYCWASASLLCEVPASRISEIDPRAVRWENCEVLTDE